MLIVRSPERISFAGGESDLQAYYEKHWSKPHCAAAI
jgi:galactokinase/mevalonate kinase-like predicted kinase